MITILTNPFPSKDPYAMARQAFCLQTLKNLASKRDVETRSVFCPSDYLNYPTSVPYLLPRDAKKSLGDPRAIPYIRDLFQVLQANYSRLPDTWFGVLNNDTITTDAFFDALCEKTDHNVLIVRVQEIPYIPNGVDLFEPVRRHCHEAIDGLFFKHASFDLWWETFPDYLFAEEWDRGMTEWVRRYRKQGIQARVLDNAECLHAAHSRPWSRDPEDRCTGCNLKLLEEFRRNE